MTAATEAQSPPPAAPPSFEVASVKRNTSGDLNSGFDARPGGIVVASNVTLRSLIRVAYQIQVSQIEGGPAWLDSDRFDINAKAGGPARQEQLVSMLKTLLGERFKLVVHTETREMQVLALVLARSDGRLGNQLRRSTVDCDALRAKSDGPLRPGPDGMPVCAGRSRAGLINARGVTMAEVARNITSLAQSYVIDRTGLTGGYDFDLQFEPDAGAGEPRKEFADNPSFSTALQEQLGLKLERQRGPVEFLVIDRAQQPEPD
jgi:uncharacterized protein (TIGR03435 family)